MLATLADCGILSVMPDYETLVRRGYQAARAGDFDAISELLANDVKWHAGDPDAIGACQNRTQALNWMRQAQQRGGIGELEDVVVSGDKVAVILRPPDDPDTLVANLTTFRDGKVVEMVHYPNAEDALALLGRDEPES